MKGLILIFVLLSGISSAIAQEKLWLDKNYQWTDDSIQAVKYALVSKINKKCIKVEEYALEGQKKDVWHFSEYKSNPRKRIREGLHTSFYANGKDSLTEVYRDNRLEGQTMVYYPDGAIHLARSYSDGKLDGTLLQYYPDGKLRREEHYSENQCTGGKMFDEHGTEMEHQPYFMFPSFPGGEAMRVKVSIPLSVRRPTSPRNYGKFLYRSSRIEVSSEQLDDGTYLRTERTRLPRQRQV